MGDFKYDMDQMRPKMIEMLYKIRREAAKYRDYCDFDELLEENNNGKESYFLKNESNRYSEIIDKIDEMIDILSRFN